MKEQTLKQFCDKNSQKEAAKLIGCTPGAIWQMLKFDRQVFIVEHKGRFSSYERKELSRSA